ncbi:MAG: hypothetical protein GOU97_01335 [Nanoarchaeota archaeon]|nr:hypothetical protein [Nanoarchaeota archaeon]
MENDQKTLKDIFLRVKPVLIMVQLLKNNDKYASVLAKEVDCTYSHTVRILQELKKKSLVEFEKKGRLKLVSLTKPGKEIATYFRDLIKSFEKVK